MNDADIDKLFEAEYGKRPSVEYVLRHARKGRRELAKWSAARDAFRAAMKSEHVKGLERDAKVEGMREAARLCFASPVTVQLGRHAGTALAVQEQLADAIRQRADQIERESPNQ